MYLSETRRAIVIVACVNVAFHVIGLALAAWGMRPGTPIVPSDERLAYLAGSPLGWSLGWGMWMLCVPVVIAFFALAARRLGEQAWLARLALQVVLVGGVIDLACDVVFLIAFPQVAAMTPVPLSLFLTMERAVGAVSLIIANGLYTTAVLLLNAALQLRGGVSAIMLAVGYGVVAFGYLLAAAGFTGVPWHVEWATGPTIGLFCLWSLLVARALSALPGPEDLPS